MQDKLNEKQINFINVYLSESDINKVCKKLNITRPTYYKYLNDDLIQQEINKIRIETLTQTTKYLQDNLKLCSKKLIEIINASDTTPQTKINAINSVFSNCNKLTEQVNIITKIEQIEQRLKASDNGGI